MRPSNVGIAIHKPTAASMLKTIAEAEAVGVENIWLTTGAGPDALTVFAAAAVTTRSVRMGTAIVPTYPRHPLVVAQQSADIAQLAPGRFLLGLGPSHATVMEGRYGIPYKKPISHLREYVAVVKSLLSGAQTDFEGEHFNVHAKLSYGADVPVIISALRAGSFETAGEICDGAVSWLCPAPYLRDVAVPAMTRGAANAGKTKPKLIAHAFLAHALGQPGEIQIFRPDAVERRQHAAEHMILAAGRAGAFERPEIGDRLHHHQRGRVASRVAAERAGIARVDIAAGRADDDLVARDVHGVGERAQELLALADQMQRRAPRRTRPHARQLGQQLDQAGDFRALETHSITRGQF